MFLINKVAPAGAAEERLPAMKVGVRQILGKVKEHRIIKAADFVEKKKKQKKQKRPSTETFERRGNGDFGFLGGVAAVLAYPFSLLSSKGGKKKAARKGKPAKEGPDSSDQGDDDGSYYQQEAYVDDGGDGNTEWEDSDMHAMKEKPAEEGAFEDIKKAKEDNK